MTALDLPAPAAIPSSRGRSEDRIRRTVRRERKEGLRLALQLRVAVMVLVGAYLLTYGLEWRHTSGREERLVGVARLAEV
jgi:hypothetical protein